MRLYTFEFAGRRRIGAEQDGHLVDLAAAHHAALYAALWGENHSNEVFGTVLPTDMLAFLKLGTPALAAARQALAFAGKQEAGVHPGLTFALDAVRILAPIPRPGKILASGINYRGHLEENPDARLPETPFFFSKLPSCVIGPGDAIIHPRLTRQLDYEVELAVVIGKTARNVAEDKILDHVAGYTIHHDVSARDIQMQDHQITLGKNFDTFAPMGPCLVTSDEIPDPTKHPLRLRTFVNGELMQDSTTGDWVFPLPRLLASLANVMTLEPGDIVSTGCPAGVGLFRYPQLWLKTGDRVAVEVERIGRLENHVVAEEPETLKRLAATMA